MSERVVVSIPKVSMAVEEVLFVEWLVPDGATVSTGEAIYSVESDKAEVEVEAAASGVLRHGAVEVDETYAVGTEVGYIEAPA